MTIFYICFFFILGTILGSFYNVVGWRLPKKESIITPPSHCSVCNAHLGVLELIPIISFIIQKGKCKHCGAKIGWYNLVFELLSGILFALSYISFGLSPQLLISTTFISMLLIIMVSDFNYMIIPDEVLLFFGILLSVEIGIFNGFQDLLLKLLQAIMAFITMYGLKILGDHMFKKESMGGGDIKLLFIFGLVLGYPIAIFTIFVASLIGLPISLISLSNNSKHIIPFGPYLSIGAILLLLLKIDFNNIINILIK